MQGRGGDVPGEAWRPLLAVCAKLMETTMTDDEPAAADGASEPTSGVGRQGARARGARTRLKKLTLWMPDLASAAQKERQPKNTSPTPKLRR